MGEEKSLCPVGPRPRPVRQPLPSHQGSEGMSILTGAVSRVRVSSLPVV